MKMMSLLLLVLIGCSVSAQKCFLNEETGVAVGLSGGYTSNQLLTGNYSIGAQVRNKWLSSGQDHLSANLQVFSNTSKVGTPVIFEGRIGHLINNSIEIYGGYGYHMIKSDAAEVKVKKLSSDFKPAYGIIKRFDHSWWTVSAGVSGNIVSLQLGMLVVR